MAIYEYECDDCGLRFEKMRKMSESATSTPCPECGVPNARKLVSAVNHTFAHAPVGGPRPQNTGVHAIDYNVDRVIGRDSEQKWKTIQERQRHKKAIIASTPGVTGHDLSRTPDGDYKVMKPAERQAAEAGRKVHRAAMDAIDKTKKSDS